MKDLAAVFAFSWAVMWAAAASADCTSRLVCDDAGECRQVQFCDDDLGLGQATAAAMTPIPAGDAPRMSTAAAEAAAAENCEQVNICGTWETVCR